MTKQIWRPWTLVGAAALVMFSAAPAQAHGKLSEAKASIARAIALLETAKDDGRHPDFRRHSTAALRFLRKAREQVERADARHHRTKRKKPAPKAKKKTDRETPKEPAPKAEPKEPAPKS